MQTLQQLLDAYAVSHQNKTNKIIHYFCVPRNFLFGSWVINEYSFGSYYQHNRYRRPFVRKLGCRLLISFDDFLHSIVIENGIFDFGFFNSMYSWEFPISPSNEFMESLGWDFCCGLDYSVLWT